MVRLRVSVDDRVSVSLKPGFDSRTDVGIGYGIAWEQLRIAAPEDASLGLAFGWSAVRASNQGSVERRGFGLEVEVELDRVVAWFAVDIDGPCERGCAVVVQPPVIGLP